MSRFVLAAASLLALAAPAAAQDMDLRQIFSNERFDKESGLLVSRGDVEFVGDVWLLPGQADSSRALVGIQIPRTELQFARVPDGGWRAAFVVTADIEPAGGGAPIQRRWEPVLEFASFDETRLSAPHVFQAEVPLAPGGYRYRLTVTDTNARESGRTDGEIQVTPPGPVALHEPVLLSELRGEGDQLDYVVLPSHAFPARPERIDFMIVGHVSGSTAAAARARLVPADAKDGTEPVDLWEQAVTPGSDGSILAFGSLTPGEALGEHRIEVSLVDASGAEIAQAKTPLMIAGSASWVAEHWKDVLALLRYEATEDELDILKKIEDPAQRVEAWACFWRMRDPIPATSTNEAMLEYLSRLQTANEAWRSGLRPGWQSDRGRVFVTLGPPNDIEQNPMPGPTQAYEVWTYQRGKQFQILFVDRIGFNNYQLESIGTYQRELAAVERRKRQFLRDRSQLCPLLQPAFAKAD